MAYFSKSKKNVMFDNIMAAPPPPPGAPPPPTSLPPGWEAHQTGDGGTYYHNSKTGETTWSAPNAPPLPNAPIPPPMPAPKGLGGNLGPVPGLPPAGRGGSIKLGPDGAPESL